MYSKKHYIINGWILRPLHCFQMLNLFHSDWQSPVSSTFSPSDKHLDELLDGTL